MTPEQVDALLNTLKQLSTRVRGLESNEVPKPETLVWGDAISQLLLLPGLRGLWPMSAVGTSGEALDLGPLGLHLTRNGTLEYDYDGLFNYAVLNGLTDYLSRASEPAFNITGTESYIANPGLTLGGWFWADTVVAGTADNLMSKWTAAGNQRAYNLFINITGEPRFTITNDGATPTAQSGIDVATGAWEFIVARFSPSSESAVFQNGTWYRNTTSIPASIYSGSADFLIGSHNAGSFLFDGRASLCFLCAAALSDAQIESIYAQQRSLFGV